MLTLRDLRYIDEVSLTLSDDIKAVSETYHRFHEKILAELMGSTRIRQVIDQDHQIANMCIEKIVFFKLSSAWINAIKNRRNDLQFSFKLYNLAWVTEAHLDIPEKIYSTPRRTLCFCSAQSALRKVVTCRMPCEKLRYLSRCCEKLFALLLEFDLKRPANADDFFPLLLFVIIKTVPTEILSHIEFIELFAQRKIIETGEIAYYLTNFISALNFIKESDESSFGISKSDFESNVNASKTEIEKMIESTLTRLSALKCRQGKLLERVKAVEDILSNKSGQ